MVISGSVPLQNLHDTLPDHSICKISQQSKVVWLPNTSKGIANISSLACLNKTRLIIVLITPKKKVHHHEMSDIAILYILNTYGI